MRTAAKRVQYQRGRSGSVSGPGGVVPKKNGSVGSFKSSVADSESFAGQGDSYDDRAAMISGKRKNTSSPGVRNLMRLSWIIFLSAIILTSVWLVIFTREMYYFETQIEDVTNSNIRTTSMFATLEAVRNLSLVVDPLAPVETPAVAVARATLQRFNNISREINDGLFVDELNTIHDFLDKRNSYSVIDSVSEPVFAFKTRNMTNLWALVQEWLDRYSVARILVNKAPRYEPFITHPC